MAKQYYKEGYIYDTPCGRIQILKLIKANKRKGISSARAVIMFTETGYVTNCQRSNIPQGKVKDRRKPSVYGVGYLDWDITIPQRGHVLRRAYDLWANMLKRCYTNEPGYEDVTVDKRWHSFKQFACTLHLVPGYDDWYYGKDVHLDKDEAECRVYSLDTVSFMSANRNLSMAANKRWHGK